jgi:hypothetical protein
MDIILLREPLHERPLESRQVGHGKLEDIRCLSSGEEECDFGVFVLLRCALLHRTLCAGIFGLSRTHIKKCY